MIRRGDPQLENRHHLIIGRSGCGKSTWLRGNAELAGAARRVWWDPDEEHAAKVRVRSVAELVAILTAAGDGPVDVALSTRATAEQFGFFCRAVWACASADRVTYVVVEELSRVTSPNSAPEAWDILCTGSRKYGIRLWAVTHSPIGIHRAIYRQAEWKWISSLDDPADLARIAPLVQAKVAELRSLAVTEKGGVKSVQYLYGATGHGFKRGTLRLKKKVP